MPFPPPPGANASDVLPTDAAVPLASRPRSIQLLLLNPHVIVRNWLSWELYATSGYWSNELDASELRPSKLPVPGLTRNPATAFVPLLVSYW